MKLDSNRSHITDRKAQPYSQSALRQNYRRVVKHKLMLGFCLILALLAAVAIGISIGGSSFSMRDSWEALWSKWWAPKEVNLQQKIIWELRVPRVLMAVVSGAGLAFSGVIMQTILKNPLASPFTLGISSAASFGAALGIIAKSSILPFLHFGSSYDMLVVGNSFLFALISMTAIYALSRLQGVTPETIVLLGVALMFLFSAATSFLQYIGDPEELAELVYWMFGSLSKATWSKLQITSVVVLVTMLIIYRKSWDFNTLMLGDETAKSTGIHVERLRMLGLMLASLTTAIVISFLGPIGFIGLVAPHLARMMVGGDHRFLIPFSCLLGAIILVAADALARTIIAPVVIPVGIVTSFVGVPLLIYLMFRRRREHW